MTSRSHVAGMGLWALCTVLGAEPARAQQSVIDIEGRQFIVECAGQGTGPAVMLLPGGDGSIEAWSKVQAGVAGFARVCSYEPAGSVQRGVPGRRQTIEDMAIDLDRVLARAAVAGPTILVGHSAGGILARRFASRFPQRVEGFVFLDSSHEEQMWRLAAIAPALLEFGFGPSWKDPETMRAMGLLPGGQRSSWHTDRPLIVIEHGVAEPPPPAAHVTPAQVKQLEVAWHAMQRDLAARSSRGDLRTAQGSGTAIHRQKPDVVVGAIRELVEKAR